MKMKMKMKMITLVMAATALAMIVLVGTNGDQTTSAPDAVSADDAHSTAPTQPPTSAPTLALVQAPAPSAQVPQLELAEAADTPTITDEEFARDYALASQHAQFTPEQDQAVRRILADMQFAYEQGRDAKLSWMWDEQGKAYHFGQMRALAGTPDGEYHRRQNNQIDRESREMTAEYIEQIEAEARAALLRVISPEQLSRFEQVFLIGEVRLIAPFAS